MRIGREAPGRATRTAGNRAACALAPFLLAAPIIGQMERAAGFAQDDTPQARLDKLDAVLARTSTPKADAALFADMLRYRTTDVIRHST